MTMNTIVKLYNCHESIWYTNIDLKRYLENKSNRCPTCDQIILVGYQSALLTKRLVNSEVWKAKNDFDIMSGNFGAIGVGANLVASPPKLNDSDEEEKEEVVDVDVDRFIENQYTNNNEQREPTRQVHEEDKFHRYDLSHMINNYNQHQPDFGQKINPNSNVYIDPSEIISTETRRQPFRIKQKPSNRSNNGYNSETNNRARLENERRQALQFNVAGQNIHSSSSNIHEEEKIASRRPPRVKTSQKKLRGRQKSIRANNMEYSNINSNSVNRSTISHKPKPRSNRIAAPWPVKIPKEVTDGIQMLRSIRMMREGSTNDTISNALIEESKSPTNYPQTDNNVSK